MAEGHHLKSPTSTDTSGCMEQIARVVLRTVSKRVYKDAWAGAGRLLNGTID